MFEQEIMKKMMDGNKGDSPYTIDEVKRAAETLVKLRQEATNQVPVPTPGDPWVHRSDRMRCASCMWWVEKAQPKSLYKSTDDPRGSLGRCRRHAPTMNGFPAVFSTDWCGDHKLDETKV